MGKIYAGAVNLFLFSFRSGLVYSKFGQQNIADFHKQRGLVQMMGIGAKVVINGCSDRSLEVNIRIPSNNYDRPTDRRDGKTEGHREVSFPIMIRNNYALRLNLNEKKRRECRIY